MDGSRRPACNATIVVETMANMTHKIGVIAGDGIGTEVIPAGVAAIQAAIRGSSPCRMH